MTLDEVLFTSAEASVADAENNVSAKAEAENSLMFFISMSIYPLFCF
ncbi:hypothetical protein FACS1894192_03550 [Bacilli bacterium]|nr:hypothetical protein FACS1894192_03550 [Bacilli bacterium]